MRPRGWGHPVLKVRDLTRSEHFYTEEIGFRVVGRRTGMVFLALAGEHHDLALFEAGSRALMPGSGNLGVVPLEEWSELSNPFDRDRMYNPGDLSLEEEP